MSMKLTEKQIFYVATGYIGFWLTRKVIQIPANIVFTVAYASAYYKEHIPTFSLRYLTKIDVESYYETNCD